MRPSGPRPSRRTIADGLPKGVADRSWAVDHAIDLRAADAVKGFSVTSEAEPIPPPACLTIPPGPPRHYENRLKLSAPLRRRKQSRLEVTAPFGPAIYDRPFRSYLVATTGRVNTVLAKPLPPAAMRSETGKASKQYRGPRHASGAIHVVTRPKPALESSFVRERRRLLSVVVL